MNRFDLHVHTEATAPYMKGALSISIVRTLVQPEFAGNITSTIFIFGLYNSIFGLYNSLRMAREVRKREETPQTVQVS